jgi:hypothetical protein
MDLAIKGKASNVSSTLTTYKEKKGDAQKVAEQENNMYDEFLAMMDKKEKIAFHFDLAVWKDMGNFALTSIEIIM